MFYEQHEFEIKCEWGLPGIRHLAPVSDVVVIIDTLSFTTCVDIAVSRGAIVHPSGWNTPLAEELAERLGAVLASRQRSTTTYSLSPASLAAIPPGTRLLLPSPNGSTLSLATGPTPTLAGCLRNAKAIANAAQELGPRVLLIPAGERWPDHTLRPAIEDMLAAGSIILHLEGRKSPEALVAQEAFRSLERNLEKILLTCTSGKELVGRGFEQDVQLATEVDVSNTVPMLIDGAYQQMIARTG